ncbi:hypothetical protein ACE1CI_18925 [Aerosakkonemataceae cyanobacterium BLCC-F50]|uniref:Uncharacterized protein n=1 Tax=Floridaenema flaviceps BLCC-F50 TaxID=3153642 RepID=A0ABV4XTC6_9CYAN
MSIKLKRLVNPYEERMLEFLHTCVEADYKIHTQVSLSQFCEINSPIDWDLRKFFFVEYKHNRNPAGDIFVQAEKLVRPATIDEIP